MFLRDKLFIKGGLWEPAIFGLFILAVPLFIRNPYYLGVFVFMGLYSLVTLGLCLLFGHAGQISLGHAAFYGLGAYGSAVLTVRFGWHPLVALLGALIISLFMAAIIGIPTLKLRGHYLAMATLGFGVIVYVAFNGAVELTGGPSGMSGIPKLTFFSFTFKSELANYFLVWSLVFLAAIMARNLINSRIGRALRAIHKSEKASGTMGIPIARVKLQIFLLSAALASIAGSLYAHHMGFVGPTSFDLHRSILFVTMVVVGGSGHLWGVLLGTALLTWLPELLRTFKDYDILIYGFILLFVLMFSPDGLISGFMSLIRRSWNIFFSPKHEGAQRS